jgi:hypothetical protein
MAEREETAVKCRVKQTRRRGFINEEKESSSSMKTCSSRAITRPQGRQVLLTQAHGFC